MEFEVGIKITGTDKGGSASISAVGNASAVTESKIKNLNKATSDAAKQTDRAANSFRGWLPHIRTTGAALGVYMGTRAVKNMLDMADASTNLAARLKLVSSSSQEAARAQEQIYRIAQANQTALLETGTLYTRVAVGLKDMGRSQADALKTVDALGKALKISGASTSEATAGLLQFAQAMTSGVVNGDEFRSIVENMPRVAKAMADGLGVSMGALRKMSADQQLTSEKAIAALLSQTGKLNEEAKRIPLTVGRAWTELTNAIIKYVGEADQAIGLTSNLAKALEFAAKHGRFLEVALTLPQRTLDGWRGMIAYMREAIGLRPQISSEMLPADKEALSKMYGVNKAISPEELKSRQQESWNQWVDAQESQLSLVRQMDKYNEVQRKNIELGIAAAQKFNIDVAMVLAIMERETHFGSLRGNPTLTSSAGAKGPMQLMPKTATRYGVEDINDIQQNIEGGVRYLRDLMALFKNDMKLVAAAYNAGEHAVIKYGKQVPPYAETRKYVGIQPDPKAPSVMDNYARWSSVLGANGSLMDYEDQLKELQKYHKDAYDAEVEHLSRRSSLYDAHAKAQIDRQKTALQQLEVDRKAAEQQAEADIVNAGVQGPEAIAEAVRKAEAEQIQFLERKKALLLDTLEVQQRVAKEQVISIGQQIQTGSDPRSPVEPDALANLKAQQREALIAMSGFQEERKRIEMTAAQEISQLRIDYEDKTRQAQKAAADANVKQITDSQKEETKAVKENQLRMNAFWDQYMSRLQDYAAIWQEITGTTVDGFSKMALAMGEYAKNVDQISQTYRDIDTGKETAFAKQLGDMAPWMEGVQQGQAALAAMAKTMLAMRSNYAEGTKGYKDMTSAAERMMEVQRALQVVEGVLAVVHQMKDGDVYTAIPRALGVMAMIASLGVNVGGAAASNANMNRSGTQGGVFGGKQDEVSTSIEKSLAILRDNSSLDLSYSAAMLASLRGIEAAMSGVTNSLIRGVGPQMVSGLGSENLSQKINPMAGFADPLTNMLHSFVMNFSKKIVGYGVQGIDQSLNQIISEGFKGASFTDVERTTKVFGMTVSKSLQTLYEKLDSQVARDITRVFQSIADALKAGGEAFKLTGDQVMSVIGNMTLNLGRIDMMGLSGEEIQKKLEEAFSSMTDNMASRLNKKASLGLRDFQLVGEGMAETFFRVAEGVNRATGELAQMNLTAIDYKKVAEKQGDVAAEIVRDTILAQMRMADGAKDYIKKLDGTAEDIIAATRKLVEASNLLKTAGIGDANLSGKMTDAAGGLSAFVDAMTTFNENFLSQGQNMAGQIQVLSDQFESMGRVLPASRDAFRDMVMGINTADDAGKKLFGQMIALSEGMAQVFNETERLTQKYASLLDPMYSIRKQIEEVGSDFTTLLTNTLAPITSKYGAKRNTQLDDKVRLDNSVSNSLKQIGILDSKIAEWEKELAGTKNKARAKKLQGWISGARDQIKGYNEAIKDANSALGPIIDQLAAIDASEVKDKLAAKTPILAQARDAMAQTLEQIFNDLAQTIQQAQQRLQSVLDLQKSIASQIAQLQGPQAVFNLASADRNNAFGAIDTYIANLADGRKRDVTVEVGLLNDAQAAVMARYNAEIAAIQEAEQAYIAAETERLNASLAAQTEAINAATEAAIKAENDRLAAAIKAQQKIDDAALKSKQQEFDASNKLVQKQFDAEQKALSKIHEAQLQALQDELDAANKLSDAIKSIAEYAAGLALSQNATLSPEARLAEAQRQYQTLVGKAQGGDVEAMGKLAGASDAYLEAAKTYYGSSTAYQDVFDGVQQAMTAIGGMSAPDPDSIQSRIDQLREAQAAEMDALRELQAEKLDAIREIQAEQLDVIREQQQASLDAMREASQAQQDAIRQAAQSQIEALQKQTQQAIADLSDPTKNRAMADAKAAAERDMKELARLAELTRSEAETQARLAREAAAQQAADAWKLANDQLTALDYNAALSLSTLNALNEILKKNAITPVTPPPIPKRAQGGYTPAGLALVGEQGPEIVRFERPAQVMTAAETRDALHGGNNEMIVQAIAELKAEMRAVVVTQSNANPQIIEKLSGMEQRLSKMERTQRFTVGA